MGGRHREKEEARRGGGTGMRRSLRYAGVSWCRITASNLSSLFGLPFILRLFIQEIFEAMLPLAATDDAYT